MCVKGFWQSQRRYCTYVLGKADSQLCLAAPLTTVYPHGRASSVVLEKGTFVPALAGQGRVRCGGTTHTAARVVMCG